MSKAKIYDLIDREGLLGLFRAGFFDPCSCEYYGTAFEDYWKHRGLSPLFGFFEKEKK